MKLLIFFYKQYSKTIPIIGKFVVGTSEPYKYLIESIAGFIFFKDSINQCYKKLDSIVNEIESLFNDIENLGKSDYKHSFDKTGKSTITDIVLRDNNGYEISIQCYDWSKDLPYTDQLRIVIDSKKFSDWIRKVN